MILSAQVLRTPAAAPPSLKAGRTKDGTKKAARDQGRPPVSDDDSDYGELPQAAGGGAVEHLGWELTNVLGLGFSLSATDLYVIGAVLLVIIGNLMGCAVVCCCCSSVFRHTGYGYSKDVRTTDDLAEPQALELVT